MKTRSAGKKIIYSVFLIIIFWFTLLIVPLLTTTSDPGLADHLPSGTTAVVKIKNRKIIKRFLFDALFSSDFSQNEVDQINFNTKDVKFVNTGIDFTEDFYIFQNIWKENKFTGFLFVINDEKAFSEFEIKNKNVIRAFNDKLGCVLVLTEETSKESLDFLEMYAADLLVPNPDKTAAKIKFNTTNKNSLFHLFFRGSDDAYVQNLSLEATVQNSVINFEGMGIKNPLITYDSINHHIMKQPGKKPFLEIQVSQLPDSINKNLKLLMNEFKLELPEIKSQQIFVYGFMIDNLNGATAFLPKFDGVFRFDEEVNIGERVNQICQHEEKVKRISSACVKIGEIVYHFKQISNKEIWIGVSDKMEFESENGAPLPRLRGNPAAVLEIEGEGIIAQFAKMLPAVQYSKKLFNDLEYFDIHTEAVSTDSLRVTGEMRFPKGKKASIELFKFMMKF